MHEKRAYEKCVLEEKKLSAEELLSGAYDEEIRSRMLAVIDIESPITEELLCKRVLQSFSLSKLGCRLEEHFRPIIESLPARHTEAEGESVFWKDEAEISYFRTSTSELRYSYQIPIEEAVNAILKALEETDRKLTKSELIQAFSDNFDYQKKGSQIQLLFKKALAQGVKSGKIKVSGNYRYYI